MTGSEGVDEDDPDESEEAASDRAPVSSSPSSSSSSSPSAAWLLRRLLPTVSIARVAGRRERGCRRRACWCWPRPTGDDGESTPGICTTAGEKDVTARGEGGRAGRAGRWASSVDGRREPEPPPPPDGKGASGGLGPFGPPRLVVEAVRRMASADTVLPPPPPLDRVRPMASDVGVAAKREALIPVTPAPLPRDGDWSPNRAGEFMGESRPPAPPRVATFRVCARTWETWRSVRTVAWMRRKSTGARNVCALCRGGQQLSVETDSGAEPYSSSPAAAQR